MEEILETLKVIAAELKRLGDIQERIFECQQNSTLRAEERILAITNASRS